MSDPISDPAKAFAGAQFRVARKEAEVTQVELYDEKLISPAALSHFENGLSWPRAKMQAKLEDRIGLPAGQIEAWRRAYRPAESSGSIVPTSDLMVSMVSALQVAVSAVESGIASMPDAASADYLPAAINNLRELRKLDDTVAAAARVAPSAQVLGTLRKVRGHYDQLLRAVAAARPRELGPRLYVARTAMQMSAAEAAATAGVDESTINDVESCQVPARAEIHALLDSLIGV